MRHWLIYINPFFRTCDFIIGCAAANIYLTNVSRRDTSVKYTFLEIALFLLAVTAIIFMQNTKLHDETFYYRLLPLYSALSCALLLILPYEKGLITRWLSCCRSLLYLGAISFEIFMIHQLVIRYFWTIASRLTAVSPSGSGGFILCLSATIALAAMLHKLHSRFSLTRAK